MTRGTTPILHFETDTDCTIYDKIQVAFEQNNNIVLLKEKKDLIVTKTYIELKLTESDTLLFNDDSMLNIQIRTGANDGENAIRNASNIIRVRVDRILKDGEL